MEEKRDGRRARLVVANRQQMRLVPMDLEGLLPEDHQARAVWAFVERLDLSEFEARIKAREGTSGRPATDPQILLGLWVLATLDGVGAAREIERLCGEHLAYQWLCGGVHVNHHSLSDFRNLSSDLLNGLLTQSVTLLIDQGLVEMRRVAQDGMKVRASAGASSFRTRKRLKALAAIASEQVEALAREIEDDPGAASKRQASTRKRAAESREKRIQRALDQMDDAAKRKGSNNGKKKTEPRTSTTDSEARVMKMPDGGFRPALNVHVTTTTDSRVVVGIVVNNEGTDHHVMVPLAEQIEERFGTRPTEWLADGGCLSLDNVNEMSERGARVYAPKRPRRNPAVKPFQRKDTDAIREWRDRMETDEAKGIYRQRGSTAEWINAQFRAQGLTRFLVRGVKKALAVVLMHALVSNARRSWALT